MNSDKVNSSKDNEDIDISMLDEADDEDRVYVTVSEVKKLMEEAWLNERFAPELLPYRVEIVECIFSQIQYIEANLEKLKADFKKPLHQFEVDRLRFLLSSYLRTRLEKIERFVFHILSRPDLKENMNENEYEFASNYKEAVEKHFDEVLNFWPGMAPYDWKNEPITPNLNSFVFLKSDKDIEGVVIDDGHDEDGDVVDLKTGSQMIISYSSVANLVKNNDVHLL